jgi:hypothetical protein
LSVERERKKERKREREREREREFGMFWGFVEMITSLGHRSQIMEGSVLRSFVKIITSLGHRSQIMEGPVLRGFVEMITSLANRSQIMEGLVLRGFVEMRQFLSLSLSPPRRSLFSLLCVCENEQSVGVLGALFLLVLSCYSCMNSGNPSLQANCTRNSFFLFALRILSAARQPVR